MKLFSLGLIVAIWLTVAHGQKNTLYAFSHTNKTDNKNVSFIQDNHNFFLFKNKNVYDKHWCTLGGIVLGVGAGFIIGYPKDYTPKLNDIRFPLLAYSFCGGIIGGIAGYIIDELVIPPLSASKESKTARLTIRGNNITLSCTL